jgi:hypothetical protein
LRANNWRIRPKFQLCGVNATSPAAETLLFIDGFDKMVSRRKAKELFQI